MKTTRVFALGAILASAWALPAHAQSSGDLDVLPAEFPPASFTDAQYVDSRGCVFIRAGIDGNVTWVPRVNRQRAQICGQAPSLATTAAEAPAPAPAQEPTAAPVVTAAAPRPVPMTQRVRVTPQKPAAEQVAVPAPRVVRMTGSTQGLTAQTRILPKHVYINNQNSGFTPVPKGYRRSWEDDRLNILRAEQTVQGYQATQLIWTDTVPRRLINLVTGKDVTGASPLVYPFTDIDVQNRRFAAAPAAKPKPVATLSTRSIPVTPRKAAPVQGRGMVQAALYRADASARSAGQQVARLGLPVTLGTVTLKGETLKVVMIGPFNSGDAQSAALRRIKAAGFANARLR